MPTFTVFKGQENGFPKQTTTTKPDKLEGDSVLVKITASGVCGTGKPEQITLSPNTTANKFCHRSPLRADMVLGHEGVGIVESVGPAVKTLKVGDRVGWGYEHDSCGHCMQCLTGNETYCPERALYGIANFDQGSFASHAIWRESYLFSTPDAISDEHAAPLQCGGATTFTALAGVKPSDVVGIMGVGGLGHLAIQFAAKMGCRVVVLSSTDKKKDEATRLGAHEFIATKGATELKATLPLNRLLVTTAAQPNWDLILPIMAPKSVIYPLTVSFKNFEIPYMPLILNGIAVQGSLVAPRSLHRQMLEFAALHNIRPIVEKFPMTEEGIKTAMEKLDAGNVYYRAVLMAQAIAKIPKAVKSASASSSSTLIKQSVYKSWIRKLLQSCSPKSEKKSIEKK
ncbi:Alcohol dehydrogenase protein [Rutstroemia sp. NJR-2017a BBW]|nr:Alcohol dehydrogenase protein [Rutstroemia sp. NJR-2017a BBW]